MIALALATALAPLAAPQGSLKPPVLLKADGETIRVPDPGYAAPAFHDIDGDGHGDLIVGQFANGQLHIYRGDGKGGFTDGGFVMVDGKPARVPDIW